MQKTYKILSDFSSDLRIWNYIASRKLSASEVNLILTKGQDFANSWLVHGAPLKAKVKVYDSAIISIMVDNSVAGASGCSIDKSVKFIQELESELGLELMDRMKFAYTQGQEINIGDCRKLDDINLDEKTLIFNHLSDNRQAFEQAWQPLNDSWLARML